MLTIFIGNRLHFMHQMPGAQILAPAAPPVRRDRPPSPHPNPAEGLRQLGDMFNDDMGMFNGIWDDLRNPPMPLFQEHAYLQPQMPLQPPPDAHAPPAHMLGARWAEVLDIAPENWVPFDEGAPGAPRRAPPRAVAPAAAAPGAYLSNTVYQHKILASHFVPQKCLKLVKH